MKYEIDSSVQGDDLSKLEALIEEDVCLSGFDIVEGVTVVEKGKETSVMYDRETEGVSFFHPIGDKTWHVRVHNIL